MDEKAMPLASVLLPPSSWMALPPPVAMDSASSIFIPTPPSPLLRSPLHFSPSLHPAKSSPCPRRQWQHHYAEAEEEGQEEQEEEEGEGQEEQEEEEEEGQGEQEEEEATRMLSACARTQHVLRFTFSPALHSPPPPRQKQDNSDKQDYYLNIGYAIRTLRDELPATFQKDLTYDIYRDDIVFQDPMNMFAGIENYKLLFWALRFHGRIFFKALWVEILRVWQPSEKVIMVRWQVRGIPRVPWEAQGIFDGTSEYKLDKDGKIYEHKVDNLALNSQKKFKVPTVADLVRETGCSSTPRPTYFLKLEILLWSFLPYLLLFSWGRYYVALKGTMDLRSVVSPGSLQPL